MILTCPSCFAKYNIPEDSLGDNGRDVRCAKCGHVWHENSPKKVLNAIIDKVQSEPVDDLFFGSEKDVKKESPKPEKKKIAVIANIKGFFKKPRAKILTKHNFAGLMVGLAIFMCLLYAVVSNRVFITNTIPQTKRVFDNLGFYIPKPPIPNAEEKLAFDRITFNEHGDGLPTISGLLVNLTSNDVDIPAMKINFMDSENKVLMSMPYKIPLGKIKGEDALPIKIKIIKDVPADVASVNIVFE